MKTRTHLIILYTLEKAVLYFFLVASLFCLVIHFITGSVQTLPIFLILAALTFSGYISTLFLRLILDFYDAVVTSKNKKEN